MYRVNGSQPWMYGRVIWELNPPRALTSPPPAKQGCPLVSRATELKLSGAPGVVSLEPFGPLLTCPLPQKAFSTSPLKVCFFFFLSIYCWPTLPDRVSVCLCWLFNEKVLYGYGHHSISCFAGHHIPSSENGAWHVGGTKWLDGKPLNY